MSPSSPPVRVRIVNMDSCMAAPGSLDNQELRHVPIVRVFGTTDGGVSACVHIHQLFPYFLVAYPEDSNSTAVDRYIQDLCSGINHAMASSMNLPPNSQKHHFVKRIILVKGIDFYGFHYGYSPFLKIYLYDPSLIRRCAHLLRNGTLMNTRFTIYESHHAFEDQVMCDFALYGCSWLELGDVFQRGDSMPIQNVTWAVSSYPPETHMPLELDTCAHHILNRLSVPARHLHAELNIPAPPPSTEPLVSSVRELWDTERRRRLEKGLPPVPEMPHVRSQASRAAGGAWEQLESMQHALCQRIVQEARWTQPQAQEWEQYVPTTFESVEALWESQHRTSIRPPATRLQVSLEQPEHTRPEDDGYQIALAIDASTDRSEPHASTSPFTPNKICCVATPIQTQVAHAQSKIHEDFAPNTTKNAFSQSSSSRHPHKRRRVGDLQDFDAAHCLQNNDSAAEQVAFAQCAPTKGELLASLADYHLPHMVYGDPHYSNPSDAPTRVIEYVGRKFDLRYGDPEWDDGIVWHDPQIQLQGKNVSAWEFAGCIAPRWDEIRLWLQDEEDQEQEKLHSATPSWPTLSSQKECPFHFQPGAVRSSSHMSVLNLEVFAMAQGDKQPDAQNDAICAVFYAFCPSATQTLETTPAHPQAYRTGIVVVGSATLNPNRLRDHEMEVVKGELDLLNRVVNLVLELDPDIVTGWDVQVASWGYLRARATSYNMHILDLCGRAGASTGRQGTESDNSTLTSNFPLVGRHVLNVWSIVCVDMALSCYTLENVAFHVLKRRMPHYPAKTLKEWLKSELPMHNSRVLKYFADRTACVLDILNETETLTKHAESARVFGIDFFSSISRGSQHKVESFLFRIGKPESFVLMSPSREDVDKQNVSYATPLILEPFAAFYSSPVVVLDFQSLYPSIMIAYNYCYSTCLGHVDHQNGHRKLGVLPEFNLPPGLLSKLKDHINIAPNGIMYAKKEVRAGLLGRMLQELLDTRIMVQQAMKSSKGDQGLYSTLDARQRSLKFISNVTYGYTSAAFSGHMPAVEIADSIVQSGRETLNQAIRTIQNTSKWDATVVYGDTDSLFIHLPGRTKEQAFRIGHDIANTITAMNPDPIKLKFEKVYLPSVLMSKKQYVGFKYDHPDEFEPVFEAKGIETVRRDGIPASREMLETAIKILFQSQDLSAIKNYCVQTWHSILDGRVQLQDFIFTKEVRMGTYSFNHPTRPGPPVSAREQPENLNREMQLADRAKYVIPKGSVRGEPLVNRSILLQEFLQLGLDLDGKYYIEHTLIPPLHRMFSLVGVDVTQWYKDMAKPQPALLKSSNGTATSRIDSHFKNMKCIICHATGLLNHGICQDCLQAPSTNTYRLEHDVHARQTATHLICMTCTGSVPGEDIKCDSLDCALFFQRLKIAEQAG